MCKLEFKAEQVNQTEHDIGRQRNLSQERVRKITVKRMLGQKKKKRKKKENYCGSPSIRQYWRGKSLILSLCVHSYLLRINL